MSAALAAAVAVLAGHVVFHQGTLFAAPVFHGLLFALIVARPLATVRFDRDVAPVDALTWSWPSALRGWAGVAALSWLLLLFGRFSGLWPARAGAGDALLSTLPNSCFFAMVPATLLGLRPGVIDTKTRPNHGIWLSARNAAMSGALALIGCFVSIVLGIVFARFGWLGSVVMLRSVNMHPGVALFLAVGGCFACSPHCASAGWTSSNTPYFACCCGGRVCVRFFIHDFSSTSRAAASSAAPAAAISSLTAR